MKGTCVTDPLHSNVTKTGGSCNEGKKSEKRSRGACTTGKLLVPGRSRCTSPKKMGGGKGRGKEKDPPVSKDVDYFYTGRYRTPKKEAPCIAGKECFGQDGGFY